MFPTHKQLPGTTFFEKSMIPQKNLRIFWGSFLVPNGRKRSDFIFFRNHDSVTKNDPDAQTHGELLGK